MQRESRVLHLLVQHNTVDVTSKPLLSRVAFSQSQCTSKARARMNVQAACPCILTLNHYCCCYCCSQRHSRGALHSWRAFSFSSFSCCFACPVQTLPRLLCDPVHAKHVPLRNTHHTLLLCFFLLFLSFFSVCEEFVIIIINPPAHRHNSTTRFYTQYRNKHSCITCIPYFLMNPFS